MAFDLHDLDQRLFGWVHRVVRGWVQPAHATNPAAVPLEVLERRLGWLASAVAERPLRIEPTDDLGGPTPTALRLPRQVGVFDDVEANVLVYVARTVLEATAARHGVFCPDGLDDTTARYAAIALVPALRSACVAELPGVGPLLDRLGRRFIASRRLGDRADAGFPHPVDALCLAALEPAAEPRVRAADGAVDGPSLRDAMTAATTVARGLVSPAGQAPARLGPTFPFVGRWLPAATSEAAVAAGHGGESRPTGSQRAARRPDAIRRIELPRDREGENPLEHSFEKVHTADTYQGGHKALDGEDQLDEHLEALEELDLREVVRTHEVARSVYTMEGSTGLESADAALGDASVAEHTVVYDEWNGRAYLRGHCTLIETRPAVPRARTRPAPSPEDAADIRRVRRVFEALATARRARGRMPTGGEVDVDALITRYAAVRAGREGTHRLYVDRPRSEPDVATLLLLDLSSSSDAYLGGVRVLDVTRAAVRALVTVLDELGTPCAIAGFHSHTRNDCRHVVLKGFDERFADVRGRLEAAEPEGYTRIGPSVRHAAATLAAVPARRRLLLLLTDGRPTDVDRYEGRHGVEDVKKAIDEAAVRGVECFALTVAERRATHLGAMFGERGYAVMRDRTELVDALVHAQAFVRR